MKILVIHHLQEMWESGYKNAGTSFFDLEREVYEHIRENKYDKIILTMFEGYNHIKFWQKFRNEYANIWTLVNEVHDYDYGWTKELCEQNNLEYTEGGAHSEVVWITDWQKQLKGHEVYIAGAFDGECIEDLEIALRYCEVDFKRINELIY